jgi:hypothetical protein
MQQVNTKQQVLRALHWGGATGQLTSSFAEKDLGGGAINGWNVYQLRWS